MKKFKSLDPLYQSKKSFEANSVEDCVDKSYCSFFIMFYQQNKHEIKRARDIEDQNWESFIFAKMSNNIKICQKAFEETLYEVKS